ncbi:hypothetical protein Ahy_B09g096723 isoform E [Arachis hypogaea]|uniref:Uncharacterized protein n=1 Tax=Arachis hypogaea TaxID=3818 RepID=A0A444XM12_ARAHY|nr:hypothetical protein Ahy_B09g096723 isoform E [Arachis hypogaea]
MEEGIAPPSRRPWGVIAGVVARRRGARVGGEEPSRSTTAEGPVAVKTVTAVVFRHRHHVVTPSSPPKALALPLLLWPPSSVACAKGERSLENKERSRVRLVPRGRGLFSRHRCCHDHRCGFKKKGNAVEVPLIWSRSLPLICSVSILALLLFHWLPYSRFILF